MAVLVSFPAHSQSNSPAEAAASSVSANALASQPRRLLRDLSQRGLTFRGLFVEDWSREWNPDPADIYGFGRSSLDLTLQLDGEKIAGWKGATASARLKQHLRQFGEGDETPVELYSNIDAPNRTTLYELWLEQKIAAGKVRLKAGKFDSNTEFAVVEGAGDFLNSSMGYSPTLLNFPTYPEPKPGVGFFLTPVKNFELRMGLFQSAGSGSFSVIEPGRRWTTRNDLPGRVSVGYWRRDGTIAGLDGESVSSTQGVYSVLEQSLWRQNLKGRDAGRALSTFLQLGQSDSHVNALIAHVGGGMVLQSPILRRPQDAIGTGATWVRISDYAQEPPSHEGEFILETYYKLTLSRHWILQEDLQYMRNPGGVASEAEWVATTRWIFSF